MSTEKIKNHKKVGAVMVVGGGIGGMQAALDLAEAGIKVYLVDNKPCIGGVMSQLDKTFPTNDCAMCTMAPRLVEIGRHKDIEIITLADIEKIDGNAGDFSITLKKRARYVNEEKCTGCGECADKCPVSIPDDYNMNLCNQKAIFRRYPQAIPNYFAIEKSGQSPCRFACPVGQRVQGYIALIREKRYEEAYRVIRRDNPFPSICGHICNHRCENECTRNQIDEPVSIMALKRFVADWAFENKIKIEEKLKEFNGKHVAIIGSGPAGLSCAHYLVKEGYRVTVFESLSVPGGMLAACIPTFRLPRDILEYEIENIRQLGIEIKTNATIGKDIQISELKSTYDAIFIAVGAHKGLKLGIPNEDAKGVVDAIEFLRKVNLGGSIQIGEKVVVVGGGNTAIDAARVARRLGKTVQIIYRRTRREMPAVEEEVEQAIDEGIDLELLTAPVKVISENGRATAIECIRMRLGDIDKTGRRKPIPVEGSEFTIKLDTLIPAIGQEPDVSFLINESGLKISRWNTIEVDSESFCTEEEGIFAGGDAVTGPQFVIDAIASGQRAAMSIDRYLKGENTRRLEPCLSKVVLTDKEIASRLRSKERRYPLPLLPKNERKSSFREVQLGYKEDEALKEADRCLNCGICSECLLCKEICKAEAIDHEMPGERSLELRAGAIILSPGYDLFDASAKLEYGYPICPNVVTALEFERILSASGPYEGKVLRPSDKTPPRRIAFIQCVGSRDSERNYCSSICCMYATKEAIIAKEHATEELECHIYYIDLRAFGKGFDEYYERAKKLGVKYIRCRPSSVEEVPGTNNLRIRYLEDDGSVQTEEYDLVVLSTGLQPPKLVRDVSRKFGVELNEHGFCATSSFRPVESSAEGIFACGPFTEPKDIPETVTQASAAAAKSLALLSEVCGTLTKSKKYPPEKDVSDQPPRIGVFICHCGTNIAGVVDVSEVVKYARTLPDVIYAEDNLYTCSNDTQEKIRKLIEEHNLNRVVVASCTPRTHEPLFRNTIREAGLNPYLFEMANIRDQCSWVHMHEPEKATRKAKDLVKMAVAKVRLLEPLQKKSVPVNHSALVIGGGLSGITAALALSDEGFIVHLIERDSQIGGNLRRIGFLLNGENPQERLNSLIQQVNQNDMIHLYTDAKILSIEGFIGNFKTRVIFNGTTSAAEEREINHGVIVVATGAQEYKPTEYLYGQDEKVITQIELENKLSNGSFNARNVVMIQCVGSRDQTHPYCSRICCSEAIKNALRIKDISPRTNVIILYRDIRTYGFAESYYRAAREKGVIFIRYEEEKKPEVTRVDNLIKVSLVDPILNTRICIDSDLLVLSTGIVPDPGNKTLAQMLKVPLNQEQFFLEAHMKLRPVDFATEGVFVCGLAHAPKLISESISQSYAVAARASTILSKDRLELEANTSQVVDENCDGCAYCIDACPYKALTLIEYVRNGTIKKTVEVDETACKGCGVCQATCPKKGIFVKGFKLEQLSAMIDAILGAA